MQLQEYVQRIDYSGEPGADYETLRGLHVAHLRCVPFENLDVWLKRPITLDLNTLYEKIIVRRRGGFCYELNGLFAWLLRALGFEVTLLSARVAKGDGVFSEAYDHLALQVRVAEEAAGGWLADVGFGDSFIQPLRLDENGEQVQEGRAFWLEETNGEHTLFRRERDGCVAAQYRFDLEPRRYEDYDERCQYNQSSPESSFTQHRMCTMAIPDGRVTMVDLRLITTVDGVREERALGNDGECWRMLHDCFGIELVMWQGIL